jgi:hypothetical protein
MIYLPFHSLPFVLSIGPICLSATYMWKRFNIFSIRVFQLSCIPLILVISTMPIMGELDVLRTFLSFSLIACVIGIAELLVVYHIAMSLLTRHYVKSLPLLSECKKVEENEFLEAFKTVIEKPLHSAEPSANGTLTNRGNGEQ